MMRILLLGSGGREHALAWKLAQSADVREIIVLPGSDGIAALDKTRCIIGNPNHVADVLACAKTEKPDLVIIGPEAPMAAGVSDVLAEAGFLVAAPSQAAAQLESSKIFSKNFMARHKIPTAAFTTCPSYDAAISVVAAWPVESKGIVLKADGLAAGKGVVVTKDRAEAEKTLYDFMQNPDCSVKTSEILIEELMHGKEVSAFAICDGKIFLPLGYVCDYKRVQDNNQGPNTGGMGGYAPQGWPSAAMKDYINLHIFKPVVDGMAAEGIPFKGILFAGLMVNGEDVHVVEFNVRFGDPETQILLPLIEDDILPLFTAAATGTLASAAPPKLKNGTAVHIVMTSEGYPETLGTGMRLGETVDMPENMLTPKANDNSLLFIGGAAKKDGVWKNTGGRVLGITAIGDDLEDARHKAYDSLDKIHFNGAHWRTDIGT